MELSLGMALGAAGARVAAETVLCCAMLKMGSRRESALDGAYSEAARIGCVTPPPERQRKVSACGAG